MSNPEPQPYNYREDPHYKGFIRALARLNIEKWERDAAAASALQQGNCEGEEVRSTLVTDTEIPPYQSVNQGRQDIQPAVHHS